MKKRAAYEIDLPGCPLQLGSPLKVPTRAWKHWGIHWRDSKQFSELVRESEEAYDLEWASTDSQGLRGIARAADLAGLGDANRRLNETVSQEVSQLPIGRQDQVGVIDLGAGSGETTGAILQAAPHLLERAHFHLVDPAKTSLEEARIKLRETDLVEEVSLWTHATKDLDALQTFEPESAGLVVANASLHHHAFLPPVFHEIGRVLRPGGWLVIGDWHCTMWLRPNRVLQMLDKVEWAGKEQQLGRLWERFGGADKADQAHTSELEAADRQIRDFWSSYARTRDPASAPFLMLEGHRPSSDYVLELVKCGIKVRRGPIRLLPGSELLSVLVAQKE